MNFAPFFTIKMVNKKNTEDQTVLFLVADSHMVNNYTGQWKPELGHAWLALLWCLTCPLKAPGLRGGGWSGWCFLNPRNRQSAAGSLCPGIFHYSTAWWHKGILGYFLHSLSTTFTTPWALCTRQRQHKELLTLSSLQPCWKQLWNITWPNSFLRQLPCASMQHRKHQPLQPPPLSPLERGPKMMPQNPQRQNLIPTSPSKLAAPVAEFCR